MKEMADHNIPVAQLPIISLAKIHTENASEIATLEQAASSTGLFFLDLRGDTQGERILARLPEIYTLAAEYFAQHEETKLKDVRLDIFPSQDLGWKSGYGGESFEVRTLNLFQFSIDLVTNITGQISRDEVALKGASITRLPKPFQDKWHSFTEFSAGCDEACLTLLNSLSASYAIHHRTSQRSDTGLKLVSHPSMAKLSDVVETLHTDSGTLTLLFYEDWGIHAFLRNANKWAFTPPMEGCALINVGDSLQRLSDGKLHSPRHRVTQPVDGAKNRYYLSYFLRPETGYLENKNATK